MKKRDIILDFTSLLDVTLIVIFFFVLFSHLESEENKALTEEKIEQLEEAIKVAEGREEAASGLMNQLEEELDIIREQDERQAANMEAMLEYIRGENIKIILDMEVDEGIIRVTNNEFVAEIGVNEDVSVELLKVIVESGYTEEETLFCDFIYDGSKGGTYTAYRKVIKAIESIRNKYSHLYYSTTNISVGKG